MGKVRLWGRLLTWLIWSSQPPYNALFHSCIGLRSQALSWESTEKSSLTQYPTNHHKDLTAQRKQMQHTETQPDHKVNSSFTTVSIHWWVWLLMFVSVHDLAWQDRDYGMFICDVLCFSIKCKVELVKLSYYFIPTVFPLTFFGEMTLWEKLFTQTAALTAMMSDWLTELNLWRMVLAETMLFRGICGYWHGADTIPGGHKQSNVETLNCVLLPGCTRAFVID